MRKSFQLFFFALIIAVLGLALSKFFAENTDPLQLDFMGFRTKNTSKGILSVVLFFSGVAVTFLLTITAVIAKSMEAGRLRRENRSLQKLLEEKAKDYSSSSKT